ncbi:hypothetical protein D3C85_907520 [compost metagenome]
MRFRSSKVNEFRLWGLAMTMGGMLLMIIGLAGIVFDWGQVGRVIAVIFMILGMISVLVSMGIYFWAGMLSTSATVIDCPECGRRTKMLGKTDRCMYCRTILTIDPQYEPVAENETASSVQSDQFEPSRQHEHKPH